MSQEYITLQLAAKEHCTVAHDNEKPKLIEWCREHKDELMKHNLYGTAQRLA